MTHPSTHYSDPAHFDLIIAGAGPCGLYAAVRAGMAGLRTLVVEQREQPHSHSRSIGIHPPSLSLLEEAGLLNDFRQHATVISAGQARSEPSGALGKLCFSAPDSHPPYILTIPQWRTELLLEKRLQSFPHVQLERGVRVEELGQPDAATRIKAGEPQTAGLHTETSNQPGTDAPAGETALWVRLSGRMQGRIHGQMLLACDGKHSTVRTMAGIAADQYSYPRRYAMGDFPDTTPFGNEAVIYLSKLGLVECFPLPGALRRWVIQQPKYRVADSAESIARIVHERCNIALDASQCRMFSEFGVEKQLARRFHAGRVVFAGDAAHVTSPIGGQGMNLGWMNTALAMELIDGIVKGQLDAPQALMTYERVARRRARRVIARAEFNMRLGGRSILNPVRNALVWSLLHSPAATVLRNRFTMRGL